MKHFCHIWDGATQSTHSSLDRVSKRFQSLVSDELSSTIHSLSSIFIADVRVIYISFFQQFRPLQLGAVTSPFLSYSIDEEEVSFRQLLSQKCCIVNRAPERMLPWSHENLHLFMSIVSRYLPYMPSWHALLAPSIYDLRTALFSKHLPSVALGSSV